MRTELPLDSIQVKEILIKGGATYKDTASHTTGGEDDANNGNQNTHCSPTMGERIQKGETLLTVSNLMTREEMDYLVRSSLATALQEEAFSGDNSDNAKSGGGYAILDRGLNGRVCRRMPTVAAAKRDCNDEQNDSDDLAILPESISTVVETVLERAFQWLDTAEKHRQVCPSVTTTLFPPPPPPQDKNTNASLVELFHNNQLKWSTREPAINIYHAPFGHFGIHKDGQALTILIPLSDPGGSGDFTGGGTAFWSQKFPREGMNDPSLVLAPPAGTALLFGGRVSHKGMQIPTGMRVVLVASFSRLDSDDGQLQ
jgi:hypothetical protein